jgi:voltage-gated potassium channel
MTPTGTEHTPKAEQRLMRLIGPIEKLNLWKAVRAIVAVVLLLVFTSATLERVVEPHTFSSYGRALWWAVVTIATVGYGDIVPASPAGRVVASAMIICSMALVPLTTSVIVSSLVARAQVTQREALEEQLDAVVKQLDRIEHLLEQPDRV